MIQPCQLKFMEFFFHNIEPSCKKMTLTRLNIYGLKHNSPTR